MNETTATVEFVNPFGLDNHVRIVNMPSEVDMYSDDDIQNAKLDRITEVAAGVFVKMKYEYARNTPTDVITTEKKKKRKSK
jgi:hypothetical protein